MKKQIMLLAFIILSTISYSQDVLTAKGGTSVTAATRVEVQEVHQSMSKGQQNSYVIHLPNAEEKMAISVWKETMKQYGGKARKKSGEYVAEADKMKELGKEVKIYAAYDRQEMTVWFEHLDGYFISTESNPESFAVIEELFNTYRFNLSKEMALENIEVQEKELKSLEKDLSKLEKENQRLHDTIERAKAAIAEAELGIESNLQGQEDKKTEIETQKDGVAEAKDKHKSITKYDNRKQ